MPSEARHFRVSNLAQIKGSVTGERRRTARLSSAEPPILKFSDDNLERFDKNTFWPSFSDQNFQFRSPQVSTIRCFICLASPAERLQRAGASFRELRESFSAEKFEALLFAKLYLCAVVRRV